uniref:Cytochrome c oxidase subunit 3 n=1 Tax=Yuukianura szeptyckii TaxID=1453868 RepID=A0A7T0M4F6_9HEXA|nr:cytochrome c oxidase subunit III [Yuukianura szeptyckii]QPL15825.1 cytochrome oxidase subunit 3 [Yuukianura szeptyckii]
MLTKNNHYFHMIDMSPWPLFASLSVLIIVSGLSNWFSNSSYILSLSGMLALLLTLYQWWRDVTRESTFQGLHTIIVMNGLRWGMILFITSEVLFFFSFFWAFFHSSLSPTFEIGATWPPLGIITFNTTQVPLLNTLILLSSGVSVTWSHHALMEGNFTQMIQAIIITIILGIYFTLLQGLEYYEASFSIADSVYGATFFVATGFHGLHVIIGTLFLFFTFIRMYLAHFSPSHHFGFEAAAWYWHFVDVVWLFLYLNLYWWGS